MIRTIDLRLVPAAVTAWVVALVVVRVPARAVPGVGAACVLTALVVLALQVPGTRRRWGGWTRAGAGPAVAFALVVGAGVALAGSVQVVARAEGLLPRLVAAGGGAVLTGRVAGEREPLPPAWPGAPERVRWLLAVSDVSTTGADRASGSAVGTVVVLETSDGPGRAAFGAVVQVEGRLRAGRPGERPVAVLLADAAPRTLRPPRAWDAAAARVRTGVRALADDLPSDAGALLPGVTVGDTTNVPDDLADAMRSSGLTHLTAVSGAHFALVAVLVLAAAGAVRAPPVGQVAAVLAAGAGMLTLVHAEPSVVRAAAMGVLVAAGLALGRPARAPAALATAVVVVLVGDPWLAGEIGFALSVAATAGLVLLGGALVRRWALVLPRALAVALAAPVAAQLACGPLVLLVGGGVSVWSVPANLAAGPAVAPATVLGLVAALVAPWWPDGALVPAALAGAACWWIGAVARVAALLPVPAWLDGPVGVAALVVASAAVARVLLRRAREAPLSPASGRLGACPLPPAPDVPPLVVPPRPG